MKYLNQLEYEKIPYPTDIETPKSEFHMGTVLLAGCGLCSLCMAVEQLTLRRFSLKQCLALSLKCGANHGVGTDMKLLGPAAAKQFQLTYGETNDLKKAVAHLRRGGRVIVNVGGDREGYTGIFSRGGHFMMLVSAGKSELCILDPSWRSDKYVEAEKEGKVRVAGNFVYCAPEVLQKEADNRSPGFYLFGRCSDEG